MLVLKSSGIDLSKSETRTIIGFSLIYSILVLVILGVITFLYYQFKKDLMLQDVRQTLQNYSNTQIANLKELHINIDKSDIYPRDERFNSAIYDSSKKKIFSTLLMGDVKLDEVIYLKDGYIHLIKEPESYYLGSKYVIVEIEDDNIWFANIKYKMLFWFLFSFILLLFVGYFIAKLFLKPLFFGTFTSKRSKSKFCSYIFDKASSPSCTQTTSKPSSSKYSQTVSLKL